MKKFDITYITYITGKDFESGNTEAERYHYITKAKDRLEAIDKFNAEIRTTPNKYSIVDWEETKINLYCDYELDAYVVTVKDWEDGCTRSYRVYTEEEFISIIKGIKRQKTESNRHLEILGARKIEKLVDFTEK